MIARPDRRGRVHRVPRFASTALDARRSGSHAVETWPRVLAMESGFRARCRQTVRLSRRHFGYSGTEASSGTPSVDRVRRPQRGGGTDQKLPRCVVSVQVARERSELAGDADLPRVVVVGKRGRRRANSVRRNGGTGEVVGKHWHPLAEPTWLARIEHGNAGRIERVDNPRASRLIHAPGSTCRPHQLRAVVPPADADSGHDKAGAVTNSQLEEAPADCSQPAAQPVARPSGQDDASANQLRQDGLAELREIRIRGARLNVPHSSRRQRDVGEPDDGGCRGPRKRFGGLRYVANTRSSHPACVGCWVHAIDLGLFASFR